MHCSDEIHYQETISLLHEEIARLEDEVRAHNEGWHEPALDDHRTIDERAQRQIAELSAELADRDETIGLLVEQARLFEEAEAANRAEWERFHQWVEEVERRVERRDEQASDARLELEAERRKAEEHRQDLEAGKRAWALQRAALESEAEHLRASLSKIARRSGTGDHSALDLLEAENRRLRDDLAELALNSAPASEVDELRAQLRATEAELDKARQELQQALDDRQRERTEHEAALAELRSQSARESLKWQEGQVRSAVAPSSDPNGAATIDERIRALRLHLQEIHEQEERERARKSLSARLSRMWRHTGPR